MKRKQLGILLFAATVFAVMVLSGAASAAWDGKSIDTTWYDDHKTESSYTITTEAQLAGLAYLVNHGHNTFKGKTIKLTADLDLNGKHWTPIGMPGATNSAWGENRLFQGKFDGQGHTIRNLVINDGYEYRGLFGFAKGSDVEIKNLNLDGVHITYQRWGGDPRYIGSLVGCGAGTISNCTVYNLDAIDYKTDGSHYPGTKVGGLAGFITSGTVRDCNVYAANPSAGGVYGYWEVGGLIGATGDRTVVENCYANAAAHGNSYIGGLVGRVEDLSGDHTGYIKNCTATGDADGASPDSVKDAVFAYGSVGGLVGGVLDDIPVRDCSATGRVLGIKNVGGLIGITKGSVSNCHASGYVAGMQYVGGLIGYDDTDGDAKHTITHSYATGNVTGTEKYAGGLVGYAKCRIDDCSASGYVKGTDAEAVGGLVGYAARSISNSKASGDVTGKIYAGGLVGDGDSSHDMILTNCQATGTVKGTTYVGGLAGRTNDHIKSCTASGTVTATGEFVGGLVGYADRTGNAKTIEYCSAEGAVTGQKNVGGLIGRSYVNVVNCHASGTVSGKPGTTRGSYIGGLIGQSAGAHSITIEKCYATGDVTDGADYVGGLIGSADDHVSTCYAAGDVSASGRCVGGLIGQAKKTIKMCYATGNVKGDIYVGGLVGDVDNEISNCYATGTVSGDSYVGGLSGMTDNNIISSAALNKEVKGTSYIGTFSGSFINNNHAVSSTSWSDMTGGGGDKGTTYSSLNIWDCYPDNMWAKLPGFSTWNGTVWQANSGNEYFKMPVLKSIGVDTESEALHLDPVSVHTVTFETEHGQPVPSQEVPTGGKVTRPTPDPLESKFWFTGWYTDSACTTEWDFDTDTVKSDMTLYAGWKMVPWWEVYQVVFDVQGHGTAPSSQYVGMGQKATEPTPEPTEDGWTFTGWYKDSVCSSLAKWDFASTVTKDMFLYAGWTQNTCLVRFDVQGIGTAPDSQFVVPGGNVSKPADPEDEKNVFEGWYKESACTNPWNFDTDTVTGDTTLYANWTPKMKVTFDVQGHGTVPDVQYVISGENATNPGDLKEDDYRFKGWYTDSSCTTEWNFATTITTDTTIYAGWIKTYHVYFNNRGHGNETETQTVDEGQPAVQPGDPVDANYNFGGWYTDSDYTEEWNFATPITGPTQIVAKWTPIQYTVTFDAQGGTDVPSQECSYGELITAPENPTKSGYGFDGWYTTASGEDRWNFATNVVTGDMTLYTHWTEEAQSITVISHPNSTVDISDHRANAGDNITITVYPDRGYNCTAITSTQTSIPTPTRNNNYWTTTFTMPNEDVEISITVAKIPLQTVTITTPVNGTITAEASNGTISNVSVSGYEGDKITLYALPETNYALKNNAVNITYNSNTTAVGMIQYDGYFTGSFVMPAYPVTVEGTFMKTTFTIDVSADDHGKIFTDPQTGSAGESVNITIVPDTGYNVSTFTVNGEDKKSALVFSGNEGVYTCTLNSDITARAEFTKIVTPYTITNASVEHGRVVTNMLNAYAGETVQVDLIGEPGYVAESATYTDTNGQTQSLKIYPISGIYSTEFVMPANDTTVSGSFKPMNITVTFNLDGTGTVSPSNKTVQYGQAYGELPTPSRDYNVFKGWYNTNGSLVTESSIVTTAGDHSLIANWSGPLTITNTQINFGTVSEGYEERTISDYILNEFAETVEVSFPNSQWFNFTNATTHESLDGKTISLEQNKGYTFNVTSKSDLPEGYYTAEVGVVTSNEVSMGNITVTMSVLSAATINDPTVATPQLPVLYTFVGGYDPTGKLSALGVEGHENLTFTGTGMDNISNVTISNAAITASNRVTIQATNTYATDALKGINGFIPLPESVIIATYPSTNLANGGTYTAALDLKEVSGNLPTLSGAFNDTIASAIQTEEGVTAIAMVSSVNNADALASMNELILDNGTCVFFTVAKSKVSDTNKLIGYHVDETEIERVPCEVTSSAGDYYTIKLTGTGFSTYVLAQSSTPVTPYVSSSSRTSGYTQILPADEAVPTTTPTATPTPTPTVPTANPTTKPATSQSPAPIAGLIAGLGAAALILARMRR